MRIEGRHQIVVEHILPCAQFGEISIVINTALVTSHTVTHAQFHIVYIVVFREERLIRCTPRQREWRESTPAVFFGETRRTIATHGSSEQVLIGIGIVESPDEGEDSPIVHRTSYRRVFQAFAELVLLVAQEVAHTRIDFAIHVVLRTGAHHYIEEVLLGKSIGISECVIPEEGSTLVSILVEVRERIGYRFPVVFRRETAVVPIFKIKPSSSFEYQMFYRGNFGKDIPQNVIAFGSVLSVDKGSTYHVADIAVLMGRRIRTWVATVFIVNRLCRQRSHCHTDVVVARFLFVVAEGEVVAKLNPRFYARLAVELHCITAVRSVEDNPILVKHPSWYVVIALVVTAWVWKRIVTHKSRAEKRFEPVGAFAPVLRISKIRALCKRTYPRGAVVVGNHFVVKRSKLAGVEHHG